MSVPVGAASAAVRSVHITAPAEAAPTGHRLDHPIVTSRLPLRRVLELMVILLAQPPQRQRAEEQSEVT